MPRFRLPSLNTAAISYALSSTRSQTYLNNGKKSLALPFFPWDDTLLHNYE